MKDSSQPARSPLGDMTIASPLKLKYYMFDWDDNVLQMPTQIYLEHKTGKGWEPCEVSTSFFATVRDDTESYRPRENDWDKAFQDFYDTGRRGDRAFLEDTMKALEPVIQGRKVPAPSFDEFREALVEGRLFAIITARAHSSSSIRQGVEYFITHVLSDRERSVMVQNLRSFIRYFEGGSEEVSDEDVLRRYLDLCRYWGVSSAEFRRQTGLEGPGSESPERAKQAAIRSFVEYVVSLLREKGVSHPVSVGFSDDDPRNVRSAEDLLRDELAREFPQVKFVVYDTSAPRSEGGRKIVIQQDPRNAEDGDL